jgi:alkanesulfonate monooxygenase SsuD/methylene tetrahydromethanopterin reductase-like flavin-dependent oxidoreductase (luciferase family)
MMPSPNIMAAALARRTDRAMILVLGNSIALYNPPIRVAEEFAMLDVISGRRLIAGFPSARRWTRTTATARTRRRSATSTARRTT